MSRSASALLGALILAAPLARAEVVILADGERLEGRLVEETPSAIVLEVVAEGGGTARVTIPRESILEIRPRALTPEELLQRGETWLAADRLDAARGAFEEARLAVRGSPAAYDGRARGDWRGGRVAEAIASARKGILLQRDHPGLHRTRGLLYEQVGDFASAVRMLERAIALAPFSALEAAVRQDLARIEEEALRIGTGDAAMALARRDFDAELGNNYEAAQLGAFAEQVARNVARGLPHDLYVEIRATPEAEYGFAQGAPVLAYRPAVQTVQFSILVDPVGWATLTELEQRALTGGWIRFAKDQYPFASVFAVVHDGSHVVFEAIWSDLRHDVIFHVRRPSDS